MTPVILGIGSNVNAAYHVRAALDALHERFGELTLSRVYESEPVGFEGSNFLNMVVRLDTCLSLGELSAWLKALEDRHGRSRSARVSDRTLDIDVLTFGDRVGDHQGVVLPRPEITRNAFVLWPLSEVWPEGRDPLSSRTYEELWRDFRLRERLRERADGQQRLWPVDFRWRGRSVSRSEDQA